MFARFSRLISLAFSLAPAYIPRVNLFRRLIALLLLCLWLPCTMHCQAESLGWLGSESACCEQSHSQAPAAPDCADCSVCSALESGGYSLAPKVVFVHALLALLAPPLPELLAPARDSVPLTLPAPDSEPQFLRQSWSFDCRTAPAPRAPSRLA